MVCVRLRRLLRCKPGHEKMLVIQLMQKYLDSQVAPPFPPACCLAPPALAALPLSLPRAYACHWLAHARVVRACLTYAALPYSHPARLPQQHTDKPLKISSALCTDFKGYIYVEAYKEAHVREATQGLNNLFYKIVQVILRTLCL